jgi:manganese-dependent ADP-ribose/CDP-alcohol diphosphatase
MQEAPLARFGVIADVQYCDEDNGWDFHHTKERFYRKSRECMLRAVNAFASSKVDLVLQLGDLIDGQCNGKQAQETLQELVQQLSACGAPILHCLGNHELYCMDKKEASRCMGVTSWYHSYVPFAGWKIIVLDSYGFCSLEKATADAAFNFLEQNNPNNVRSNKVNWLAGLHGPQKRFVPYNGALGAKQLKWLEGELRDVKCKVLICSHIPLCVGAAGDECLLWDYEQAMEVLAIARSQVVAVFSGHDHDGGYCADSNGVHHVTFPSP